MFRARHRSSLKVTTLLDAEERADSQATLRSEIYTLFYFTYLFITS